MFKRLCLGLLVLVMSVGLTGCTERSAEDVKASKSFQLDTAVTESTVEKLNAGQPVPVLDYSQERAQLIERQKRINNPNRVSYVALIDHGVVMSTYTIKGKVSSLNSLVTNPTKIILKGLGNESGVYSWISVPSPDIDGSYGENPKGIFFFTPEGRMVEWGGNYMWQDTPFTLTTPPILVANIKNK